VPVPPHEHPEAVQLPFDRAVVPSKLESALPHGAAVHAEAMTPVRSDGSSVAATQDTASAGTSRRTKAKRRPTIVPIMPRIRHTQVADTYLYEDAGVPSSHMTCSYVDTARKACERFFITRPSVVMTSLSELPKAQNEIISWWPSCDATVPGSVQ